MNKKNVLDRLANPKPTFINAKSFRNRGSDTRDDKIKVYVPKTPIARYMPTSASASGGPFVAEIIDKWPPRTDMKIIMMNKASYVAPEKHDVSQRTSNNMPVDQYQNLLLEQYGFDPGNDLDKIQRMETVIALQKALCGTNVISKVENSSQCANANTTQTTTNGTITDLLCGDFCNPVEVAKEPKGKLDVNDVEICTTPRMKVIAEMYSRYKKNNIELRRLEERAVCLEYDVCAKDDPSKKPVQYMRAYFFVKTGGDKNDQLKEVPSILMDSLRIGEASFVNNSHREVEIIDDKNPENQPYLKDFFELLQRRRAIKTKQKKSSLDLKSMYVMACNEMPARDHDYSTTNLLSKAELDEVKCQILEKCESRIKNLIRKKMSNCENNVSGSKKSLKAESAFLAALHADFKT